MSVRIEAKDLQKWIERLFVAAKLSYEHALWASDVFVRATLRGLGHHDVSYLPERLSWLSEKGVNPCPSFKPIVRSPAAEIWDADKALGEVACRFALEKAMALARKSAVGYCVVKSSNHFLAAAPYTEIASQKGFFALVWSNTSACMSFPFGNLPQIGNNPLGFAFPLPNKESLNADICLAYSSLGNLKSAVKDHQDLPLHWGVDSQGKPSHDPKEMLKGAVRPIGEHKGFALALLGEMLTGLIAGGTTLDQVSATQGINTHNQAVLVWDLELLGGLQAACEKALDFKRRLKAQDPEIRIPGERSQQHQTKALKEGLTIDQNTWELLTRWSTKNQVQLPVVSHSTSYKKIVPGRMK